MSVAREEKMRRGTDLDEVLVNFMQPFLVFYEKISGKKIPFENLRSYNFWEWGIGENRTEVIELVDRFYMTEDFARLPTVEGAEKAVTKFAKEGELWILTSRPKRYRAKTERMIRRYFPGVNGNIIFTGDFDGGEMETKAETCRELCIEEMYEDNIHYAEACSKYARRVFLFDKPWNQGETGRNITRVGSWREALGRKHEY